MASSEHNHYLLQVVVADKPIGSTIQNLKDLIWPSPSDEIPFWKRDFASWDVSSEHPVDKEKDSDPMHIIHVTAEMAPIAKLVAWVMLSLDSPVRVCLVAIKWISCSLSMSVSRNSRSTSWHYSVRITRTMMEIGSQLMHTVG